MHRRCSGLACDAKRRVIRPPALRCHRAIGDREIFLGKALQWRARTRGRCDSRRTSTFLDTGDPRSPHAKPPTAVWRVAPAPVHASWRESRVGWRTYPWGALNGSGRRPTVTSARATSSRLEFGLLAFLRATGRWPSNHGGSHGCSCAEAFFVGVCRRPPHNAFSLSAPPAWAFPYPSPLARATGCCVAALLHLTQRSRRTWPFAHNNDAALPCRVLEARLPRRRSTCHSPLSGVPLHPQRSSLLHLKRPSHLSLYPHQRRTPALLRPTNATPLYPGVPCTPTYLLVSSPRTLHPLVHHGHKHCYPPHVQLFLRQVGGLLLRVDRQAVRVRRRLWLRLHHD